MGIVRIGHSDVTGTSLSAARTASFGTATPTSDGFTVNIANYDSSFSWAGTATIGSLTIGNNGLVTVTGLAPNTSSTVTVTATKTGFVSSSATITATALQVARTSSFGTATPTSDGFSFSIANYDSSFSWAGTATNGSVNISNNGLVTVTGVAPNTSSTVTITTTKTGFGSGSASITATTLKAALTASFGSATPTSDGFSFIISNVDASFNWAGTATNGGLVAISNTGLVTVTGVAPNTSSTVTITATKAGFAMGWATIIATTLQPAGTASFGTVTPTSDGFSFTIANYDPSFSWAGNATNGGSVAISNTGLVTVTGLALNTSSTVTITSFKIGFAPRTATITSTAAQGVERKLTVGTFNGYVAIYQQGYEGHTLTAKVAGKWIRIGSIASNFERTVRYTGAGYGIFAHLYIDGTWMKTVETITK